MEQEEYSLFSLTRLMTQTLEMKTQDSRPGRTSVPEERTRFPKETLN
jgi:hypothetical protein